MKALRPVLVVLAVVGALYVARCQGVRDGAARERVKADTRRIKKLRVTRLAGTEAS